MQPVRSDAGYTNMRKNWSCLYRGSHRPLEPCPHRWAVSRLKNSLEMQNLRPYRHFNKIPSWCECTLKLRNTNLLDIIFILFLMIKRVTNLFIKLVLCVEEKRGQAGTLTVPTSGHLNLSSFKKSPRHPVYPLPGNSRMSEGPEGWWRLLAAWDGGCSLEVLLWRYRGKSNRHRESM